jgi:uncharacterized protein YndB with AHSA1/START domain
MKYVWITLIALVALVAIVALVGALLPKDHAAARRITVPAPAAVVFAAIRDFDAYPQWAPGIRSVQWLPDRDGRRVVREEGPHGPMDLCLEREEPGRLLVTRIVTEGSPFGGTWTCRLDERDGRTTVTLTENGEVYNVVFRALARFVFGYTATIEAFLPALARRCGTPAATPEPCDPDPPPIRPA